MKRTISVATLSVLALFILSIGCGNPAQGTLQSITLTSASTGLINLYGEGATLQLVATGNYSNKQATKVLTSVVTYTATPVGTNEQGTPLPTTSATSPQTISVSPTGLVTAVTPFACTWENFGTKTTPAWFLTGSYKVTATFQNITSQPIYIAVASAAGSGPNDQGQCGPAASSGG